jgi:TolB-like protein/Flp pilus assembly protein TadD
LRPTKEKFESLAVLPLENMGQDPDQEYFADGMTEALITELSKISALRVISRTSAMQYKGVKKPLPQIARELNVDALIEGSVLREGDQVRITVQLIQGTTDKHLWAESYQRELRGVLVLQSEMARAIAREIGMMVSLEDQVRLASARRVNPEAHELYLKGRHFWNQRTDEGLMKSIEYFQQAIAIDPMYALGYAGLADAYNILGSNRLRDPKEVFPKARTAAERALELDENLAEAHAVLGAIKFNYEWDWAGARRALRRSIELNPGYATAHQRYALLSSILGEHEVAIEEMKLARRLDPLSARISVNVGSMLFRAREYEQAIVELRKALELYPNDAAAHSGLGAVYVQKGMYEEAIKEFKEVRRFIPDAQAGLGGLGYAYAVSGDKTEATKILKQLQQLSERRFVPPATVALIHIGLGDKNRAFEWLEKAYQDRNPTLSGLRVDPRFDPLRDDPRFRDLLLRMNLPN